MSYPTTLNYSSQYGLQDEKRTTEVCTDCKQIVPPSCTRCDQYIVEDKRKDEEKCETCGQDLPDEEDDSEDEELPLTDKYVTEDKKNGSRRVVCKLCNHKRSSCPNCEHDLSDEFDDDESESSDEEEDAPARKKGKGTTKLT